MKETWFVWQNMFGALSVDNSEHGHYNSDLLGIFDTYEEAMRFADLLEEKDTPKSPAGG